MILKRIRIRVLFDPNVIHVMFSFFLLLKYFQDVKRIHIAFMLFRIFNSYICTLRFVYFIFVDTLK